MGELSRLSRQQYDTDPVKYRHGKSTMGILIAKLQQDLGENPELIRVSTHIKIPQLEEIAAILWPN